MTETKFGRKTSEWLSVNNLPGRHIVGNHVKITKALIQYQKDMPDDIQLKQSGTRVVLCLRVEAIDKFCELAKLMRRDIHLDDVTPEWLTANDLTTTYIVGENGRIKTALEKYQKDMPNDIQLKRNGRHTALHLRESAVADFCKRAGLVQTKDKRDNKKTSKWLNATKLTGKYIVGDYRKIMIALEKYQSAMPQYIQIKYSGNRSALCLQRSAIGDFCAMSGLKRATNSIDQKTAKWLTATELVGKYIIEDRMRIKIMLNRYKNAMPEDIKFVSNGPAMILCLNKNGIDKFCEMSGLVKATKNMSVLKSKVSYQR